MTSSTDLPRTWTEALEAVEAHSEATLVPVHGPEDILPEYRGTPIESLLAHHNLGQRMAPAETPQLVIATCMDHRINLSLPERFAYVTRTAGAVVSPVLFNLATAIAVAGVRAIAIIGHSDCAMVDVERHRGPFMDAMQSVGTLPDQQAVELFEDGASCYGVDDAAVHTLRQTVALRTVFPDVVVGALFYDVHDGGLSQVQ